MSELLSYIQSLLEDYKRRLTNSISRIYNNCYESTDTVLKNIKAQMQEIEKSKQ